jgi:endonuclease/exonuclease/phosphatase family metal-dependent hydrolase
VVVAGDFNSNVTHTPPEQTPSVGKMLTAGYIDTWPVVNHGNPGFTWPLYVEDPLAAHPEGPFERIDFIFERGFTIRSVDRIGWKAPHASDHAGVVATLAF